MPHSTPSSPPSATATKSLDGRRVAVVGSGEALARVLGLLHREGAACEAVNDPYRVVGLVAGSSGVSAVVLVLPCLYPEEMAVVGALRRLTGVPVIVAAADGLMSQLSAAIREGATAILTERGIDWLGVPASTGPLPPAATPGSTEVTPPPTPIRSTPQVDVTTPEDRFDELSEESGPPPEPVLSAEELRALLQEPVPVARGVSRTTSTPTPDWT